MSAQAARRSIGRSAWRRRRRQGPKCPRKRPKARESAIRMHFRQQNDKDEIVDASAYCETLQNKVKIIPKISKMMRSEKLCLAEAKLFGFNPKQPKEFGVKFRSTKIRGIFPHKLRNFKLGKMPKSLTFRFPEGRYFLNFDNTELKRCSNFFFCFRTASVLPDSTIS